VNGLDLFSGIGGITLALSPWVRPVAYCENDRYAQAILLSRQASGDLPIAPIWDDIRTLTYSILPVVKIDIIYGGFPCQDISVAGLGAGLEGKRSGLFSRSCGWPKKSDPNSYSLKTSVPSELLAFQLSEKNWPASAMIVDGILYPLKRLERRISEGAGSSSQHYPTPRVCSGKRSSGMNRSEFYEKMGILNQSGGSLNPTWVEWLMGYPSEWTACEDWAIPLFRFRRERRLKD
jgi:hypothetical protein